MRALEAEMAEHAGAEMLREYDALANRFQVGGGYEMDTQTDKICNGLAIPAEQRGTGRSTACPAERRRA